MGVRTKRRTGSGMTRQEEWETQKVITEVPRPNPVSQVTGRHKRNTRDRGAYSGYTKSAVLKLIEKKKGYVHSKTEKEAMLAYFDERLANMGASVSAGTPDWLKYDGSAVKTTTVDPLIPCGSFECRPDKW